MKTILIVEPYKILQYAIAVSLFPQYDARMAAVVSLGEIEGVDAVVIDASSLRETGALTAEAMAWLQQCDLPVVWIDKDNVPPARKAKSVLIETPVERNNLQKALAECLDETAKTMRNGSAPASGDADRLAVHVSAGEAQPEIIELVDVVQEESAGNKP